MISVLTVNYRSSEDLRLLAESISRNGGDHSLELIITNNSPEDPIALPALSGLRTRVLNSQNVGFGRGINRAYQEATGDLLLVVNPDVRVEPGAIHEAVRFLEENTDVGMVLPLLKSPDGTVQWSVRRFYTWPVVLYARSPFRSLKHQPSFFREYLCEDLDRTQPTDVDWGLGGACFLRRRDFESRQIFDERFFLYFEDVDLCYRMWQQGRRVVYCPHVQCIHAHRRSSRVAFSKAGWHHFQSLVKFIKKYGGLPRR